MKTYLALCLVALMIVATIGIASAAKSGQVILVNKHGGRIVVPASQIDGPAGFNTNRSDFWKQDNIDCISTQLPR